MTRWNINARVLLVALVPALLIALLLGFYFTHTRVADLEQSLAARGRMLARQLSLAAEFGVYSGNREILDRLVTTVARELDVTAVTIRDAAGTVLAHSGDAAIVGHDPRAGAPEQSEENAGQILVSSAPILQSRMALEEFFDAPGDAGQAAHSAAPRILGRAYIAISRAPLAAERQRVVFDTLTITLLILAANVFLAARMSRRVARPVVKLTQAVQRLAQGDLDARVAPDSDGVVRSLEDGVNAMASALKSAQAHLEQRVADATEQLAQKKEEAEHANQAKSRFLAAASHDLRQPLHALGLFVASLTDKPLPDEVRRTVTQIDKSVVAMQDLLDALLDISRLDAGTVTPKLADFPVYRLLSAMETSYALNAERKGIELRTVPSSVAVRSDPILLERILHNLVSNAVRYTARGKVLLGCRRRGAHLRIEVWDTGVGIAADQLRLIFDEFYRVTDPLAEERGLGLGLAIVDRLARLLGHKISVRSVPGKGSMFAIDVPCAIGAAAEGEAVAPAADSAEFPATLIMVIDDDHAALAATRTLFESWGCRVLTAGSGTEAEAQLRKRPERPGLFVCDYRLSHTETGIELLDRLRTLTRGDTPAVVISADTSIEVQRAAEASGYPLLHKPLRPAKLRALTHHLLTRARE